MIQKETLFLILKGKWYRQIAAGTKNIEYREFNEFWFKRFAGKKFSFVLFQLGYSSTAPRMIIPIIKIDVGPEPNGKTDYFRIHLKIDEIKHLVVAPQKTENQ